MKREEVLKYYHCALRDIKKHWEYNENLTESELITKGLTLNYEVKTKNPWANILRNLNLLLWNTTSGSMFPYTFDSYNNPRLNYRSMAETNKSKRLRMTASHTYFEKAMYQPSALKCLGKVSRQLEFLLPSDSSAVRSVLPVLIISYILKYKESMDKSMDKFVKDSYNVDLTSKKINDKLRCFIPEPLINKLKKCSYNQMTPIDIRMHRRRYICLIFAELVLVYKDYCNVTLSFQMFNELTGYMDVFLSPITLHVLSKFDLDAIGEDPLKTEICMVFNDEITRNKDMCDFCVRCRTAKFMYNTGKDIDDLQHDEGDDDDDDDDDKGLWKETPKERRLRLETMILDALRFSLSHKELKMVISYLKLENSLDNLLNEWLQFGRESYEDTDSEDDDEADGEDDDEANGEDDDEADEDTGEEDNDSDEEDDEDDYDEIGKKEKKALDYSIYRSEFDYGQYYQRFLADYRIIKVDKSETFWATRIRRERFIFKKT